VPSIISSYWNEVLPALCGHYRKRYSHCKCDVTLYGVRVTLAAEVESILYCEDFEEIDRLDISCYCRIHKRTGFFYVHGTVHR